MDKVRTFLWFDKGAEEAVRLYVSLLPGSAIGASDTMPADSPSGPAGSVKVIDFTLAGRDYVAMEAGPLDPFNHSVSLMVECDDQAEVDRLWSALGEGGSYEPCGWLKDRWGLSWQIVPRVLNEMMQDTDRARAARVANAMLGMGKLEIAGLRAAWEGEPVA